MKKLPLIAATSTLLALALALATSTPANADCTYPPIKPIVPPAGCKDLQPVCRCYKNHRTGDLDCHWEWICIPYNNPFPPDPSPR
jgi:hypothetical protein